jgi:hypothetical protein
VFCYERVLDGTHGAGATLSLSRTSEDTLFTAL